MNIKHYFYQDKPLFGLDIGFSSIKVMQVDTTGKHPNIVGYGVSQFDKTAVNKGEIVDFEALASAFTGLFNNLEGKIDTPRVALTIPASKTFSRFIKLPKIEEKDLADVVRTETEQYIPVPINNLYIDFDITSRTDKDMELFAVATPKNIVNSYLSLMKILGLEVVAIETTTAAAARLFMQTDLIDIPTVIIDFGAVSTDITIFDKTLIVTGTIDVGADTFSEIIAKSLGVTDDEADVIKTKYGLDFSKKQREISKALEPILDQLLKELRRMIRYYEERYGKERKISQVVTMGGGSNMPGLNEHLVSTLRLPVRMSDPWQHLGHSKLQPPNIVAKSMYATVAGSALLKPKEIFR